MWEQEGYLRARPCFRGDIEEELKRVDVNGQHTEAARTTTPTAAAEAWFSDLAHVPDLCWTTVMIGLAWLSGISAVPGCRGLQVTGLKVRKERAARCWKRGGRAGTQSSSHSARHSAVRSRAP